MDHRNLQVGRAVRVRKAVLSVAATLIVAVAAARCAGSSPTSNPSPSPAPTPSPAPAPTPATPTYTIAGAISDATTGRAIGGGSVSVVDGTNANKGSSTDGNGYYSIPALAGGSFTLRATAAGYNNADKGLTLSADTRVDLALPPIPPAPSPSPSPTPTPKCAVIVSPSGYSGVGADAGGGGINVSAPVGCSWTVITSAAWVTIQRTRSGPGAGETWTGPGEVSFNITANTTGASRTAVLAIGDQTFTLQQNAYSCDQASASVSPTSMSFGKAGGTATISVTYTQGCSWDWLPASNVDWVAAVSPGVKVGSTTVSYTVAPNNTGASRIVFLAIVGKSFQIVQAAN